MLINVGLQFDYLYKQNPPLCCLCLLPLSFTGQVFIFVNFPKCTHFKHPRVNYCNKYSILF